MRVWEGLCFHAGKDGVTTSLDKRSYILLLDKLLRLTHESRDDYLVVVTALEKMRGGSPVELVDASSTPRHDVLAM